MNLKSNPERCGAIAVSIHWLNAVLILALLGSGFYVVILGMVASGIGIVILSGAAPAAFGAPGVVLPTFTDYPPRGPHGLGAFLLVALLVLHGGAALYHQFIRGDGPLGRMWYSDRR